MATRYYVKQLLQKLPELYRNMDCSKCKGPLQFPVRNRRCGHYYCQACLEKIRCFCPQCKQYFQEDDIYCDNLATKTTQYVEEIHNSLIPILQVDVELEKIPVQNESEPKLEIMNLHFSGQRKGSPHSLKAQNKTTSQYSCTETTLESKEAQGEIPSGSNEGTSYGETVPTDTFLHDGIMYHVNYFKNKDKRNMKGETPLHLMCKKKQVEKVKALLCNKVDLNDQDFAGWTPLHEAVQSQSIDIVKELLVRGAIPDIPGIGYITPLHKAVLLANENIMKLLLEYGANKSSRDNSGKKPIEYISDENIKQIFEETEKCIDIPRELFCAEDIVAYCYHIEDSYREKLRKTKTKIEEEYDFKKVTHFILRKNLKVSLKILIAMLRGTTIVPQEWIDYFINKKYFIPVPTYTYVSDETLNKGIQKAMLNSMLKLPSLFNGMKFFIHEHKNIVKIYNIKVTKLNLTELVVAGGGKVLVRQPSITTCTGAYSYPYHSNITDISPCCDFIIFDENGPPPLRYSMQEIKHKTSRWLIDCVLNFTILP